MLYSNKKYKSKNKSKKYLQLLTALKEQLIPQSKVYSMRICKQHSTTSKKR